MIKCACLVEIKADKILLVRVRENEKYYLPGGKIEDGETAEVALKRELSEELSVEIEKFEYLTTIIGPAYPQTELVEIQAFKTKEYLDIQIKNEITDIKWIDLKDNGKMAPAVNLLIEKLDKGTDSK